MRHLRSTRRRASARSRAASDIYIYVDGAACTCACRSMCRRLQLQIWTLASYSARPASGHRVNHPNSGVDDVCSEIKAQAAWKSVTSQFRRSHAHAYAHRYRVDIRAVHVDIVSRRIQEPTGIHTEHEAAQAPTDRPRSPTGAAAQQVCNRMRTRDVEHSAPSAMAQQARCGSMHYGGGAGDASMHWGDGAADGDTMETRWATSQRWSCRGRA
jgi:hypothetical protein